MQVSRDILETQIDTLFESICRGLRELNADLERLPYVVQEKMERQRLYNFFEHLLAEDRSNEMSEVKENPAQNLADVFKSAEVKPGQDARVVLRDLYDRHEVKPTNTLGPKQ